MLKILHVDDDQLDNQLFSANLLKTTALFDLDWAESSEQALEMLRSSSYDCILCDYQMPGASGLQLLSSLRQQGIDIPFIFYTGQGNESIAADAFRMGADDYYSKEEGFAKLDRLVNSMKKTIAAYQNHQSQIFAENAVYQLETKTAGLTGQKYLENLLISLADILNTKFAFVGEISGAEQDKIRTLCVCSDGQILDNIIYELKDTPCHDVVGKTACTYHENVQQEFPNDTLLVEMGVDSYIGIPLFDSTQDVTGIMVLLDDKPMPETSYIRSLLVVYAARASAEIERMRYTKSLIESEVKYRQLFENNIGGIFRTAEDGTILESNIAFMNILGYGLPQEIERLNVRDLYVNPEERDLMIAALKEKGELKNFEVMVKNRQGNHIRVACTIKLLDDNTFFGMFLDITYLKKFGP